MPSGWQGYGVNLTLKALRAKCKAYFGVVLNLRECLIWGTPVLEELLLV
jgi:hypothetical protein